VLSELLLEGSDAMAFVDTDAARGLNTSRSFSSFSFVEATAVLRFPEPDDLVRRAITLKSFIEKFPYVRLEGIVPAGRRAFHWTQTFPT